MKIIGHTENGYLIDASREEIANLIGYYGTYCDEYKNKRIGIGSEIQVHEMYNQLYQLAYKYDDISRAKENLTKCIELLDLVHPVIDVSVKR